MSKCPCCDGTGEIPEPTTDEQRAHFATLQKAFAAYGERSHPTLGDAYTALKKRQGETDSP